jgi:multiple sugar transport system permease protein
MPNVDIGKRRKLYFDIIAVFIVLLFLFPVYWIIINSFKRDSEIFSNIPTLWPRNFTLQAYTDQMQNLFIQFRNSMIIAGGSLAISLLFSVPAGYGIARYRMRGTHFFILTFLVTQMLPASLVLTPLFLIFSKMKLINTFIAPIISTATVSIPFNVLLLRPNFLSIPVELEDAAKIDGCNPLMSFLHIAVPITRPAIITALCFSFVMAWNDLAYSMTFCSKDGMRPMTAAIYNFMNQYGTKWNSIMAYGVLLILPTCIIFVTMQKYIVSGLVSGSVKG